MELRFQCLGPDHWKTEVLLAPVFQGESLHEASPLLDKAAPWLAIAPAARDFRGKKNELSLLHGHPQQNVPRVLAIGLGKAEEFTPGVLREAVAAAVRRCRALEVEGLLLPEALLSRLPGGRDRLVEESAYAALLALCAFRDLKKEDPDAPRDPQWLTFAFDGDYVPDASREAARRGERAAQAVMLARDLANTPPNMLAPADLAERAERIARSVGLGCTVLDEEAMRAEGMGALLAVGQGSARPPRLVVLEHAPEGHEQDKPLVLVGKGITFDTGGICIKPAAKMHTMKCDMTGAADVLAVLVALAEEGTPAGSSASWPAPRTCPTATPAVPATWCAPPPATLWKSRIPTPRDGSCSATPCTMPRRCGPPPPWWISPLSPARAPWPLAARWPASSPMTMPLPNA